jgi:hypothetical protein
MKKKDKISSVPRMVQEHPVDGVNTSAVSSKRKRPECEVGGARSPKKTRVRKGQVEGLIDIDWAHRMRSSMNRQVDDAPEIVAIEIVDLSKKVDSGNESGSGSGNEGSASSSRGKKEERSRPRIVQTTNRKKAETGHEKGGREVEGGKMYGGLFDDRSAAGSEGDVDEAARTEAHDIAWEQVKSTLSVMQSKGAHEWGSGIPDEMHEVWPECPASRQCSVAECKRPCPNHFYASVVVELLLGFEFPKGKEPSMQELHGLMMLACGNGWYGYDLLALRKSIGIVLALAGAVEVRTADIEQLAGEYYQAKRCVKAEGKHWYFLKRMRSALARIMARRAIAAMESCGITLSQGKEKQELSTIGE